MRDGEIKVKDGAKANGGLQWVKGRGRCGCIGPASPPGGTWTNVDAAANWPAMFDVDENSISARPNSLAQRL